MTLTLKSNIRGIKPCERCGELAFTQYADENQQTYYYHPECEEQTRATIEEEDTDR